MPITNCPKVFGMAVSSPVAGSMVRGVPPIRFEMLKGAWKVIGRKGGGAWEGSGAEFPKLAPSNGLHIE